MNRQSINISARIIVLLCSLLIGDIANAQDSFFEKADQFFKKHVKDGLVEYKAVQNDPELLNELIKEIQSPSISLLDQTQQKAFLINTYNLLSIKAIIDHYPVETPFGIPGFFDKKKFEVNGQMLTLNQIEKEKLLKQHKDARLHFVLVCAAMDCPPLLNLAFRPEILETQMNERTQIALNNPGFIKIDKKEKQVVVSEIFRWYSSEFENAGGIRNFINQYRKEAIPQDFKIKYYTYNWALNDLSHFNESGRYRASALMKTGQVELKIFNSLYTEKSYDGFDKLNSRSTYFSTYFQFLYGWNNNLNIGADIVYKSNVVNDLAGDFPLEVFDFQNFSQFQTINCQDEGQNISPFSTCRMGGMQSAFDTLRHADGKVLQTHGSFGFSHIGPKIKFTPIKRIGGLSLQQTFYIPVQKFVDGQTVSFTQFFYDKPIGSNQQLFIEGSLWTVLSPEFRLSAFLKGFYSFFPSNKWTFYVMASVPVEYGLGAKYFINPNLELELLYTYYLPIESFMGEKRPQTFNIGIRYFR